MRSPRLAVLELRRFGRGKLPRAALAALLLLPLLYGALLPAGRSGTLYGRLDRIPVALVNDDKGASVAGKKLSAGEDITKGLRDSDTFEWHEVSAAEAAGAVEDGNVPPVADHAVRLQPEDRLQLRTGSGDGLQVRTNDANNYIVGQISRTVFGEVRTAASTKASRSFLDKIFISFSDIHRGDREGRQGGRQAQRWHHQGPEGLRGPRRRPEGRQGGQWQALRRPAEARQVPAIWLMARGRSPTARGRWPTRSTGSRATRWAPS